MASLRSGSTVSSSDRSQSRGHRGPTIPKGELQNASNRPARRDLSLMGAAGLPSSQPRIGPSRIPQTQTTRKTSSQIAPVRPPLTHETQSWSTASGPTQPAHTTMAASGGGDDASAMSRNVLRRKSSTKSREPESLRAKFRSNSARTDSSSSIPRSQTSIDYNASYSDRSITASPVEIRIAQQVEVSRPSTQNPTIYPELDRYRDIELPVPRDGISRDLPYRLTTEDLPPPTPLFSGASSRSQLSNFSASPSTRFSESPGPGPYSRDTTPTSISSQSPGLIAPIRLSAARVKQTTPTETRPPVTRRRAGSISNDGEARNADLHGLAAVREALTSSSSNSTVRTEVRKAKKIVQGRSPNPPPRQSSQKFTNSRNVDDPQSPSRPSRIPAQPVIRAPSPKRLTKQSSQRKQEHATSSQARPAPPSRPSRDGTPDLYPNFGGPVPVIQSNLSSTSLSDRRQSAQLAPSLLPRATTPSNRDHSLPSKVQPSREPTPAPRVGVPGGAQSTKTEGTRVARTPSPSVASAFKSRFPLFGRRTKTATEGKTEKKDKSTRKGPAAGTGHEGYGRVGAVKRRTSNIADVPPHGLPGAFSSSESLASAQSTDPFLLERMNPVIIAGGEVVENRNTSFDLTRTESNQSAASGRSGTASRNDSSLSTSSQDDPRYTLWPSSFPRASAHIRHPSDSSDADAVRTKPTIATRRSTRGSRSADNSIALPKPIKTRGLTSPSVGSVDTTILTDDSLSKALPGPTRNQQKTAVPSKLTKQSKSPRRWNLFSRSQTPAVKNAIKEPEVSILTADKPVQSKAVAFYTMMDSSEQEDSGEQDVHDILKEAEVFHQRNASTSSRRKGSTFAAASHSTSLPSNPPGSAKARAPSGEKLTATKEKRTSLMESDVSSAIKGRPSRLPQVGRIPKVINTRPEQTSPKSFSRPFHRVSLQLSSPQLGYEDKDSVAKGPSPPRPSTPQQAHDEREVIVTISGSLPEHVPTHQLQTQELGSSTKEFLAFPPRKNSESTGSSCSAAPSLPNYTAVPPTPSAPLGEDEVWDEYDDLLNDAPPSPSSSRGVPFHLETYDSRSFKKPAKPSGPTGSAAQVGNDVRDSVEVGQAATSSSHYSGDMTARINNAFRFNSDPPSASFSVSEFVSGYGERNRNDDKDASASVRHSSSSSQNAKRISASSNKRSSGSSRNSEETPLSQVNLRVGSMTVSKWLTFGHVLFSPVREDLINVVGSLKRHSILVMDGLGNDDWSFYAAETYPAATFFNLSPRAPVPRDTQAASSFPLSPPNHHQIQLSSHKEKFPFGPDSFTSFVFRFPSAAPESHYRNIISEARRVLKPGGYIELSILDVDLNNMGNRTRRAVRRLKERVNTKNPDYNLSSTADIILRLLGKQGFVDIKNCRVGVPVASALPNAPTRKDGKKDERSLAEMMNDESETGDENITKMVSKVGRWWYNRCYEVPTGMGTSIWNDRALLAECEEWATSLKLMVCYARIPDAGGRVASI